MSNLKRILVTGGAGFLGSHLCERLIAEQHDVICVDNFFTSQKTNIAHLLEKPNFELIRHDITFPLYLEVDEIFNLACPAAPEHYQYDPISTIKTSVAGSINILAWQSVTEQKSYKPQLARFMAIQRFIRNLSHTAVKSIRLVHVPVTTKANALPKLFSWITGGCTKYQFVLFGYSTPTVPACIRSMDVLFQISSGRHSEGSRSRFSETVHKHGLFAIAMTWSKQ